MDTRSFETSVEDVGDRSEVLDIEGRMRRNPYGMVAGAVAIGFVMGGGLFTRLTARIAGVGLRMGLAAAWPLLQQQLFAKKESDR
jgi:hypothetical protein